MYLWDQAGLRARPSGTLRGPGAGAWNVTEPRLARLPDDGRYLVGTEGPHRVRADAAERPDLKEGRRRRFVVGERLARSHRSAQTAGYLATTSAGQQRQTC
jgi:hypothetical protein